jgi:hypothetical protein
MSLVASNPHGPSQPDAGSTSDSTQTLVYVCTAAHYDKDNQFCMQDDSTIRNLAGAHLTVYTAGQQFSTDRLIVNVVRRNSDGSSSPLGSTTWTENRTSGVDWILYDSVASIPDVFRETRVAPQAGTTYQITVRSGRQSLGSATFTYQPAG